jgi:hypothetical protein
VYGILKAVSDVETRMKMIRNEKELKARGIEPPVSKGMAFNLKTNKIEETQGTSISWYRRLMK